MADGKTRDYSEVTSSVIYITPEMAKEWLKKNTVNRNISVQKVQNYARDMRAGEWHMNGEPICFRKDGSLADGQHRLTAISQQSAPIPMMVVWGIDNDVTVYDRGRNRGLPDIIGISKEEVSLVRACYHAKGVLVVSDGAVGDFAEKHRETIDKVFEIVPRTHRSGASRLRTTAMFDAAAFFALKCGVPENLISEFWKIACTGYADKATNNPTPCITFRNDILEKKINPIGGGVDRRKAIYAAEKAISDYVSNKQRKNTYSKQETPVYSEGVEI